MQADRNLCAALLGRNLLRRGYVDDAIHWRYSSARNYVGKEGLIDVDVVF